MLLSTQRIELPSWAFRGADVRADDPAAPTARRLRAISPVARGPYEVLADAAVVHHFTGAAPCVGLPFPCDATADYADIACHAAELGLTVSSLYVTVGNRSGAMCDLEHPQRTVRQQALDNLAHALCAADELGVERVVVRLGHDPRYAGLVERAARVDRLGTGLQSAYNDFPLGVSLALEEFSLGTQHWAGEPLWRSTLRLCEQLGGAARLMVDTSIDHGVDAPALADLSMTDRLAGVIVPNLVTPMSNGFGLPDHLLASSRFEVFSTLAEVFTGNSAGPNPLLTLAPSSYQQPGIVPLIQNVLAIQHLCVQVADCDVEQLKAALQSNDDNDPAGIQAVLSSCERDVSAQLSQLRRELGVDPDPLAAYERGCRARYQLMERRASVQRAAERRLATKRPERRGRASATRYPATNTGAPASATGHAWRGGSAAIDTSV